MCTRSEAAKEIISRQYLNPSGHEVVEHPRVVVDLKLSSGFVGGRFSVRKQS
jgi:hypothetical protein